MKKPGAGGIQKKFCCPVCCKVLRKQTFLKVHLNLAHNDQKLVCDICEKVFYTDAVMENHKNLSHSGKIYVCILCSRQYTDKGELKIHFRKHAVFISKNRERLQDMVKKLRKNLISCNVCEETFVGDNNLDDHLRAHVSSVEASNCTVRIERLKDKALFCKLCGIVLVNKAVLRMHMKKHDPSNDSNNPKQYIKPIVLVSSTKSNKKKSINVKQKKTKLKEIYLSCTLCSKEFLRMGNLDRHKCKKIVPKIKKLKQKEFEFFDCGVTIKEELKMEYDPEQCFDDPLSLLEPETDASTFQYDQYAREELVLEDTSASQDCGGTMNANIAKSTEETENTRKGEDKPNEIECITIDDDKLLPTAEVNALNPEDVDFTPVESVPEYLDLSGQESVKFLYYKDTKMQ